MPRNVAGVTLVSLTRIRQHTKSSSTKFPPASTKCTLASLDLKMWPQNAFILLFHSSRPRCKIDVAVMSPSPRDQRHGKDMEERHDRLAGREEKAQWSTLSQLPWSSLPVRLGKREASLFDLFNTKRCDLEPSPDMFGLRCRGENIRLDIDTVTRNGPDWEGGKVRGGEEAGCVYSILSLTQTADLLSSFAKRAPFPKRTVVDQAIKPV